MDYGKTYDRLIQKRRDNPISRNECYCERHHIIPKSEGGSDDDTNLVNLTAREHYIAHLLLARIYDDFKMWAAIKLMLTGHIKRRTFRHNSRLYAVSRERWARKHSELLKSRPTPQGSLEGLRKAWRTPSGRMTGKHHTQKAKDKIREKRLGMTWKQKVPFSEEHRRKLAEKKIGKRWYNNGVEQGQFYERPDGWNDGMLKSGKSNLHWFTNGIEEKRADVCPEGFVLGRLNLK